MNYLAHTLLSTKHIDYQIGNLLSDTLKGRPWANSSAKHRAGLAMHKTIDRFTDDSPIVDVAIARLGNGYLKGVVVDITFDHFLTKHWQHFVSISQSAFTDTFYRQAQAQLTGLPPAGQHFIKRVIDHDILNAYRTFDDLSRVLTRVNRRLSEKLLSKESATDYLPRLAAKYDALEADFLTFFPTLIALFLAHNPTGEDGHYFK